MESTTCARLQRCKQLVAESIEQAAERLACLSADIWSQPELAYEERRAHDRLTSYFSEEGGWAVEPHYKLETAFRAEWLQGGEGAAPLHVGFLCEYDALPGIGHACGHNLIAEVGAAAALGLRAACENLPEPARRALKITVLGTPAEEDGGGKIDLLEAGAFEDMDVVFMAHPGQDDAAYLLDVAVHDVTVKYYGKASHAAAYPWEGINALDAAVLAYNNLSVLRQQMKPTWRVHGVIKNGGVKPNIIPSYSELEFYLRAPTRKDLTCMQEKADGCFRAAAIATGCTVEINNGQHDYYNVLPNKTLAKTYRENGKVLGMEFTTDALVLNCPSGSTDFGNVTFVVPGIHAYFYIGTDALNHTEQYTEAAGILTTCCSDARKFKIFLGLMSSSIFLIPRASSTGVDSNPVGTGFPGDTGLGTGVNQSISVSSALDIRSKPSEKFSMQDASFSYDCSDISTPPGCGAHRFAICSRAVDSTREYVALKSPGAESNQTGVNANVPCLHSCALVLDAGVGPN